MPHRDSNLRLRLRQLEAGADLRVDVSLLPGIQREAVPHSRQIDVRVDSLDFIEQRGGFVREGSKDTAKSWTSSS